MAKDPAVLFYTSDFLSGTFTMTDEQVGRYIRLLCLQHQKGVLSEKDMLSICKAYDEDVFSKFEKTDAGFVNTRLKNEAEKRKNFSESRRHNAQSIKNQTNKNKKTSKAYAKHMENENVNENRNENTDALIIPFGQNFPFWKGWKDYKRQEHREGYRSLKTEQAAIDKLFELSRGDPEEAKKIIEQSIANRWKGLFELRKNGTTKNQSGFTREGVQQELERTLEKRRQAASQSVP